MRGSRSELRLRRVALTAVAATALITGVFFVVQNRLAPVGGEVAFVKALWLGLALLFWLVLPALIVGDSRLESAVRRPFQLLLALMAARGVAELVMLYGFRNWSPSYGIAHDLLCLGVLSAWGINRLGRRSAIADPTLSRTLLIHLFFTAALFLPEIYFAAYMQAHFTTAGAAAVYFVPDDGRHRLVLAVTAVVDALATAYLGFFLYAWLNTSANAPTPSPGS
jgi:hypothetical protein